MGRFLFAIFLFSSGSACKKSDEEIQAQRTRQEQMSKEQDRLRQVEFTTGENTVYLFDSLSETCVAVRYEGSRVGYAWPVSCAKVKDKLDPAAQVQVNAMLKTLPAECPR